MLLLAAIEFAAARHGDQKYSQYPYLKHLMDVMAIIQHFYPTKDFEFLHVASVLHDVLEDTDTTYGEVAFRFGKYAADIVQKVTNPPYDGMQILTRADKHKIQYPIIAQDNGAIAVKLADRIANVASGEKIDMYLKEQKFFKDTLIGDRKLPLTLSWTEQKMWDMLDSFLYGPFPEPVEKWEGVIPMFDFSWNRKLVAGDNYGSIAA